MTKNLDSHPPQSNTVVSQELDNLQSKTDSREAHTAERGAGEWHEGSPSHPWDKEWFIALTTYGDRVVLKALPEEFTYDFKTADDTYIKRDKIKAWMQFPDSAYVPFSTPHTPETAPVSEVGETSVSDEMVDRGHAASPVEYAAEFDKSSTRKIIEAALRGSK